MELMSGMRLSWFGGKGWIFVASVEKEGGEAEEDGGGCCSMEGSSSRSSLCGDSGVANVAGWNVGEVRRAMTS